MNRLMRGFGPACLLVCVSAFAQTLSHRKPSAGTPLAPTTSHGAPASIPPGAEGEYRWGESGEVIELYEEGGQLHGYLTRRSERRDAASTPITFAFTSASADEQGVSFATRSIHGDSYSFLGRLVRGAASTPQQDGYYLLVGTLTMHQGRAGTSSSSSAPGSADADDRLVGDPAAPSPGALDVVTRAVRLPRTADSHSAR